MEFNLADLFECVVDEVADREAVVCGGQRLTYRELEERANRLAHAMGRLGAGPGDHVGLYLRTGIEHLVAILAAYKLRAVPVNVNPRYVADELVYLGSDADLVGLLYEQDLAPIVRKVEPSIASLRWTLGLGAAYDATVAAGGPERDFGTRSADDHYVLYTGGTTGSPKGVVWRHEDIFFATMGGGNPGGAPITHPAAIGPNARDNHAQRVGPFLPAGDSGPTSFVSLALGPLTHASGQWSALGTLLGGGTVVLYDLAHMDMGVVCDLVRDERVVALNLVGDTSARPLLAELQTRGPAGMGSLLLLGSGGSIFSAEVKHALLDALPSVLAIVDGIGSSEVPAQAVAVTTRAGAVSRSLRFAAKDTTVVIDDDLQPVAPGSGSIGRLATRGRLPLGYYNDPVKTDATFVELDGVRWTMPGDMATVEADGTIRLLGRGSMCINTGGEKVFPEEVEAAVKSHPRVADGVVVGEPDPRWGEHVAAIVEPVDAGDPPGLDELVAHCRTRLAGYKVPRALHVVDAVQRTLAGKADYRWAKAVSEARRAAASPAGDRARRRER